jgi:lipopolysaccharide biosynthesis glycosyltransferase
MNISECDLEAGCKNIVSYHYSKEAMSRLFADIYFPQYEKIIYSDVDVVFTDDVSQAWFMPIKKSCYVAGVKHLQKTNETVSAENAITNSGFLIMNLKRIREDRMGQQWREIMETNRQDWWDQDIINACCRSNIGLLPLRFNVCQIDYRSKTDFRTNIYSSEEIMKAMNRATMIHYITGNKPWNTIFSQKQSVWLRELMDTGLVVRFIFCFPLWTLKWFLKNHNLFRGIRKARKYILKKIIYTINNKR